MKVMHIAQSAGYGVTIYVNTLIQGLKELGYEQVLLGSDYYNTEEYRRLLDEVFIIHMDRNITKRDFKTIIETRKIVRQVRPDIVYCHSAKAGIYGRLACLGTSTKVVYNPHGWAFNMHCSKAKRSFYIVVEAIFSRMTNAIVAISQYEKQSTPSVIQRKKIIAIENGIQVKKDLALLNTSTLKRKDLGIPEDAFVVGLIARISIQKGQDLLVQVAKQVVRIIPHAYFLNVGGKSDAVPIEKMIDEAALRERFIITGEVEDAIRYAKLFDVAVLTSRWEGFGLVLPEYMLAGKAIVAFDVDAVSESVRNGENGLLVEAENIEQMTKAICRLFDEPLLRNQMGKNGKEIAEKEFDIKRVIESHHRLFQELN